MENTPIRDMAGDVNNMRVADMTWKLNVVNHSAEDEGGNVVRFDRVDGVWYADPANPEALEAWNQALSEGADLLERVGKFLFGDLWKRSLAAAINVHDNTPRHWHSGKTPFTTDHPKWADIAALIRRDRDEFWDQSTDLLTDIAKATKRADVPTSKRFAGNREA